MAARWLSLILGGLAACAAEDAGAPVARDVLAERPTFEVEPAASEATLHLVVHAGDAELALAIDAPLLGGVFVGALDRDELWLDEVVLNHGMMPLPFGDDGAAWIVSLDVRVDGALVFPDTSWSDDGAYAMTAPAAGLVTLAWRIMPGGGLHFFDYERTTILDASAIALSDDDAVRVRVSGATHQVSWEWAGLRVSSWLDVSIEGGVP